MTSFQRLITLQLLVCFVGIVQGRGANHMKSIIQYLDPRLSLVAQPVTPEDFANPALYDFGCELLAIMDQHNGAGLAATQVGVHKRMFAMLHGTNADGKKLVSIVCNPEIVEASDFEKGEEACLSFPGASEILSAPTSVVVKFDTIDGQPVDTMFMGLQARTYFHEFQHVNGATMLDRMGKLQRRLFLQRYGKASVKAMRAVS